MAVETGGKVPSEERRPYSGNLRTLEDLRFSGETVLVRADLDVKVNLPPEEQLRLKVLKPTVDYLLENGAKNVILLGHLGRPTYSNHYQSTARLTASLKIALGRHVDFLKSTSKIPTSKVSVFENLRFFRGERDYDPTFADELSQMGTVYVNDAFGNSHRDHISMVALPQKMPQQAAGRRVVEEVEQLEAVLGKPRERKISLIGGAKIDTKLPVVDMLSETSELVLLGGKMPREVAEQNIALPPNVGLARPDENGRDIDGASTALFAHILGHDADTIIWNGPMGVIRPIQLREGVESEISTSEIAHAIAKSKAYSVVGGGDTLSYLAELGILDQFTFTSMGGGAMLDFISGKPLPALEVLRK